MTRVTIIGDYTGKYKDGIFFKPLEDLNLIEDETMWHPLVMDKELFEVFNKKALSCVFPYIISKDWRKDRQHYNMNNFVPSIRSVLTRLKNYPCRLYILGGKQLYKEVLKLPIHLHYHILLDRNGFDPAIVPKGLSLKGWKAEDCFDTMFLERFP